MKVFYLGVWKNAEKEDLSELVSAFDLSTFSRWHRNAVTEVIRAATKIIAGCTKAPNRSVLPDEDQGYVMYVDCRIEGICAFAICDLEYPESAGKSCVFDLADEFTKKFARNDLLKRLKKEEITAQWDSVIKAKLVTFQDPHEADKMAKIQSELDETKFILHKTIESVLERGEKLDSLVQKSDELSASSKVFYTQAKKQNSCCIVM